MEQVTEYIHHLCLAYVQSWQSYMGISGSKYIIT
jgi:hypothetical protein